MKNIGLVLSHLQDDGKSDMPIGATVIENAVKEFEALKAAGIAVEIENVERVRVTKTKMRRGGKRTKKSE
jgi:hypothetical protein